MIEAILWVVAGFIIWETIYLWMIIESPTGWGEKKKNDWINAKLMALILTAIFIGFQAFLVFATGETERNYLALLWEFGTAGGTVLFFWINHKIYYWINPKGKKK